MTNTAKHANSQRHPLSPAERTAQLLGFKRGFTHNFTANKVPSKVIATAGARFTTS